MIINSIKSIASSLTRWFIPYTAAFIVLLLVYGLSALVLGLIMSLSFWASGILTTNPPRHR